MGKKIVIVGGVAGGASAAARLRRMDENAEIILFERGEYISFANCGLPYYIGGVITERANLLLQTPKSMNRRFNIDVRVNKEVVAIDRAAKTVTVRDCLTGETSAESYDKLVLSPGAKPVAPPLPGAMLPGVFTLRDMKDCDTIKEYVDNVKPRQALVLGSGFIGLEMMENLAHTGVEVVNVEKLDQVLAPLDADMAAHLHRHIRKKGVDLRLGTGLTGIEQSGDRLQCALDDGSKIEVDLVILSVGIRPDNTLAKEAGLELDGHAIAVDEQMLTSDPDIYAVGDAVSTANFITGEKQVFALAGPANRQGRMVADNICGAGQSYGGTQGTLVCKVFDLTAGATGSNEKQLRAQKITYDKVYLHPGSHASYYPGAQPIAIKLLFAPGSGRVLGAQAVGADGVDKRIDVFATAMRAGLTVFDLQQLELSYAPPYSSAKDPVNFAGFIAGNVIEGKLKQIFIEDIAGLDPQKDFLVDIRTPGEFAQGTLPGAINIPVDDMRERVAEFPKGKRIVLFCRVGLRGYLGCRILMQNGYDEVYNLSGGYLSWEPVYGG